MIRYSEVSKSLGASNFDLKGLEMNANTSFLTNPLSVSEFEGDDPSFMSCLFEALGKFYYPMTYHRRNSKLYLTTYFLDNEPVYEIQQEFDPDDEHAVYPATLSVNLEFVRRHRELFEETVLKKWLNDNRLLDEAEAEVYGWSRSAEKMQRLVDQWTDKVKQFFAQLD